MQSARCHAGRALYGCLILGAAPCLDAPRRGSLGGCARRAVGQGLCYRGEQPAALIGGDGAVQLGAGSRDRRWAVVGQALPIACEQFVEVAHDFSLNYGGPGGQSRRDSFVTVLGGADSGC
jgi:hypothetical protein